MGYVVKEEDVQTGEVTRRGPFVTEQEARLAKSARELGAGEDALRTIGAGSEHAGRACMPNGFPFAV